MPHDSALAAELGRTRIFSGLAPKHLNRLADRTRVVDHAPGVLIVSEGASGAGFHLVLDGTATVLQHGTPCATLGPGDHFGEISLIDGQPRSATVRAETPLRTASVTPWDFAPLLQEEPTFALALLRGLCQRLRETEAVPAG